MGADIHLYVEYKDDKGNWITPEREQIDILSYNARSYVMFAILADVRNTFDIVPISQPRGVPEDAQEWYKKMIKEGEEYKGGWGCDCFSASYYTLTELKKYDWDAAHSQIKKTFPNDGVKDGNFYTRFMPSLEELAKKHGGDDNVRIVFFFDN